MSSIAGRFPRLKSQNRSGKLKQLKDDDQALEGKGKACFSMKFLRYFTWTSDIASAKQKLL